MTPLSPTPSPVATGGSTGTTGPAPRQAPLWVLAFCVIGGTLAMHIFVPALPYAAEGLKASSGQMQLTISLYIAGLAVGQLIYGPVSDRIGRRPTLMLGLVIYTASGVAAWLAPSAGLLIVARLFQALGGCAGLVMGRAIIRDTSAPQEAAGRMALMNLMVTAGPGVAPLLGGTLAGVLGWRSIFVALALMGVVGLVLAWRWVPESRPADLRAMPVRQLARDYFGLLRSPAFMGYSIAGGCSTTAMYAFIAAAPFVFVQNLGRDPHEVGVLVALLASGVWLGSILANRLVRRVPLRLLLMASNGFSLSGALVLLVGVLAGVLSLPLVMGSTFMFTLGVGVSSPAASVQAVSVNPRVVGSASGLYGFIQMAVGAICTALAGLGSDPALAAAVVLVTAAAIGQAACWVAQAGQDRPPRPATTVIETR